jgi:hypothetical protein
MTGEVEEEEMANFGIRQFLFERYPIIRKCMGKGQQRHSTCDIDDNVPGHFVERGIDEGVRQFSI